MARRQSIPKPEDLLTVREACELYKVGRSSLYRWADDGLITMYKVGGRVRIDRTQVEKHVIRRSIRVANPRVRSTAIEVVS